MKDPAYRALQAALTTDRRPVILACLAMLTFRDRTIVELYLGLGEGGRMHTQREIARVFRVTSARIGQMLRRSVAKVVAASGVVVGGDLP